MLRRGYLFIILLNTLCWVPASFELTLNLHSAGSSWLGKLLDLLFYVPFTIAFLFGLVEGKSVIPVVVISSLIAAMASDVASVWDMNLSIEGGWDYYGSWFGLVLFMTFTIVPTGVLALFGSWIKEIWLRRKQLT